MMTRPVGPEHRRLPRQERGGQPGQARKVLETNGVKFVDPAPTKRGATRKVMHGATSDSLIKDAKLSPEIVKLVKESVGIGVIACACAEAHDDDLGRVERTLVGLLGALACWSAWSRWSAATSFPSYAISWAEEVIVYLVVWGVMIISSQLVRTDGHVRPDLVLRIVRRGRSAGWRCSTASWHWSSASAWCGTAGRSSTLAWMLDERSATDFAFPMWIYYAALPVGGAADVRALLHPPVALPVPLRSGDHDGRPHRAEHDMIRAPD